MFRSRLVGLKRLYFTLVLLVVGLVVGGQYAYQYRVASFQKASAWEHLLASQGALGQELQVQGHKLEKARLRNRSGQLYRQQTQEGLERFAANHRALMAPLDSLGYQPRPLEAWQGFVAKATPAADSLLAYSKALMLATDSLPATAFARYYQAHQAYGRALQNYHQLLAKQDPTSGTRYGAIAVGLTVGVMLLLLLLSVIIVNPLFREAKNDREAMENIHHELQRSSGNLRYTEEEVLSSLNDLKGLQEQLALTESKYRDIVEFADDLIYEFDSKGYIIYVNPTMERATGIRRSAFKTMRYWELVKRSHRDRVQGFYKEQFAKRKRDSYYELPFETSTGRIIWIGQNAKVDYEQGQVKMVRVIARDITQLKLAKEQLRERETLYRLLSENSRDVIGLHNPDGTYRYISNSIQELLGYEPNELIGRNPFEFFHPDDLPGSGNATTAPALNDGSESKTEYRMRRKDGHYVWLETMAKPIFDDHGQLVNIQTSSRDISQRKEQDDLLKSKQNELMAFVRAAPAAIAMFDKNVDYIATSQKWLQDYGLENNNVVGKNHFEVCPGHWEGLKPQFEQALKGKVHKSSETRFVGADNSYSWIRYEIRPWYMGNIIGGIIMLTEDITEQKRAQRLNEIQQKRVEEVYRIISEVSGDFEAQISRVLAMATRHLNMEQGMLGQIEEGEYILLDAFTNKEKFAIGTVFDLSKTFCGFLQDGNRLMAVANVTESNYNGHPAHQQWGVEAFIALNVYVNGKRFGSLSFWRKHALAKEWEQIDKDFVQLIGQWVGSAIERSHFERALIDAKRRAEEASQAKAQFLSTMSHEIRTPMNAVIGMTHLLEQEDPKPAQLDNLKTLRFSAENLLALINDILDFNKIEAGRVTLEEVPFNLAALLEGVRQSMRYRIEEKGIYLQTHLDPAVPQYLLGDPVRLTQVLNNLVGNAIKFTNQGGVQVNVQLKAAQNSAVTLHVQVHDTGIGIAPGKLSSIFESFTQASSDTTRKYGGTGLGLAITQKLLSVMNAQIKVKSTLEQGSTFYFDISLKVAPQQTLEVAQNEPVTGQELPAGNASILLVEDNEINKKVARKFLRKWGLEPDMADNGKMAVEMASQHEYDIILMDLQMPVMDGYEAAQKIRQLPGNHYEHLPIIALTASAMTEVRDRALAAGMTDYISKPFNPVELKQKLGHYLKGSMASNLAS